MYTVFYNNGQETLDLHVDDVIDQEAQFIEVVPNIDWIQADGHELDAIQEMFSNRNSIGDPITYTIPMDRTGCVVRWAGDIARTIHLNLINCTKGFAHV